MGYLTKIEERLARTEDALFSALCALESLGPGSRVDLNRHLPALSSLKETSKIDEAEVAHRRTSRDANQESRKPSIGLDVPALAKDPTTVKNSSNNESNPTPAMRSKAEALLQARRDLYF